MSQKTHFKVKRFFFNSLIRVCTLTQKCMLLNTQRTPYLSPIAAIYTKHHIMDIPIFFLSVKSQLFICVFVTEFKLHSWKWASLYLHNIYLGTKFRNRNLNIPILSEVFLLLVTSSLEVLIYRVILPDNNRFSLPCWDLQEVGGTLSGFGLWSPEVTMSQFGDIFSSAPRAWFSGMGFKITGCL